MGLVKFLRKKRLFSRPEGRKDNAKPNALLKLQNFPSSGTSEHEQGEHTPIFMHFIKKYKQKHEEKVYMFYKKWFLFFYTHVLRLLHH